MIAVDTSALLAVVFNEPDAERCAAALRSQGRLIISAATLAEALIVAARREVNAELQRLIVGLGIEVVSVTSASARQVADAYARWGKGVHPAGLNFGDCFAYQVAKEHDCPLLYVGEDFALTDIAGA